MRRASAIGSAGAKPTAALILSTQCEPTLAIANTAALMMQTGDAYPEFAASPCRNAAWAEVAVPGTGVESAQSTALADTCSVTPKRKALRRPTTVRRPTLTPVGSITVRTKMATPKRAGINSRSTASSQRRVRVRTSMDVRRCALITDEQSFGAPSDETSSGIAQCKRCQLLHWRLRAALEISYPTIA